MSKSIAAPVPSMMEQWLATALRATRSAERFPTDLTSDHALMQIAQLALTIESDIALFREWYQTSPILEYDALTAQELVARGDSMLVMAFLRSIRQKERG